MALNSDHKEGHAQHQLIIQKALEMGIKVQDLSPENEACMTRLSNGIEDYTLKQGIIEEWIHDKAAMICDEKHQTKDLFKTLGVPSPMSHVFQHVNDLQNQLESGTSYVCKPITGTNGVGVQLDVLSVKDVAKYLNTYGHLGSSHLLEVFVSGYDVRIMVIDAKIVAVCLRIPAYVIGDGSSTLNQLIEQRKIEIKKQNPANDLVIDQSTDELLKDQGVLGQDIIIRGRKIRLKTVANMAQGAHAIDVTDEIDPIYREWVERISDALNINYFALDLISENHREFKYRNTFALEINIRAEWMHHTFSERRTHDLASIILNSLFKND